MTSVPMSNQTPSSAPVPGAASRGSPAAPVSNAPGAAIDPVKLLMKYKYILGGAAGIGMVVGVVAYVLLLKFSPTWTSNVMFQAFTPSNNPISPTAVGNMESQNEIERFMLTEARQMTREDVLNRVATDPRLPREAPNWVAKFDEGGRINVVEAVRALQDAARTRIVPGTRLIELSASTRWRDDSTALAKLLKEAYMTELRTVGQRSTQFQRDQLQSQIESLQRELRDQQTRRESLLREANVSTLNEQGSELLQRLYILNSRILETQNEVEIKKIQKKQLEDQMSDPAGIQFTDQIRAEVEQDPLVISIKQQIQAAEADLKGMLMRGLTREHREYKRLDSTLQGMNQNLGQVREDLLTKRFNANLENLSIMLQSMENQTAEMTKQRDTLAAQSQVVARALATVRDLDEKIGNTQRAIADLQKDLNTATMLAATPTTLRILVVGDERRPQEVSSPKIQVILPAAVLGVLGLVTAMILAIELMDSRVKGPADITLMPRTRLLGWIPDSSEDPAGAGAVETTFRDRPRGAIAENYRQVRSVLSKRMTQAGHRSLVVIGGMPGSGSTSVTCNLALSWAAADKKVLIIDANFRRSGVHRVFALRETPGLADVLTGTPIDEAIQPTSDPHLFVLSAGSREKRVFEMFSGERFSTLLAELKARFDYVLVDVAPALVASDGAAIANRCDASALVVRALGEKRGLVARLRNDLSETRGEFLGVIVNAVKPSAGGYIRGNLRATHEYQNLGETNAAA